MPSRAFVDCVCDITGPHVGAAAVRPSECDVTSTRPAMLHQQELVRFDRRFWEERLSAWFSSPGFGQGRERRQTVLAIISSSSVRMTRTTTRLAAAEIMPSLAAFRFSSSSIPRNPRPSQAQARTAGAFSPMPPAKTSVSSPPTPPRMRRSIF